MIRLSFLLLIIAGTLLSCSPRQLSGGSKEIELQNPIIPGYFADPSLVQYDGRYYLYATADPWGGDFLACWESSDFQNWTFHKLNWPTKEMCTSPLSNENMVWAPSVIRKGDKFYMYISVGSEIWCGVADHPLGPWENMLEDKPVIPYDTSRFYHVIDAETFIDDDGKAYLYWGSGWEWTNGHCFAAELNDGMKSFKSEPVEVTPAHYFEGPLMFKRNNKYYLTYSEGKTIDKTYEVRYAVGDSPLGPFTEAENSPILKTDDSLGVYGPGHHTVFSTENKDYILYHRHRLPFEEGSAYRQICINEFEVDTINHRIKNIIPVQRQPFPDLNSPENRQVYAKSIKSSSEFAAYTVIDNISDNHYGTRWQAADNDNESWITAEFEPNTLVKYLGIRFEYPWKTYYPKVEVSNDGQTWEVVANFYERGVTGSPVIIPVNNNVSFVRINFKQMDDTKISIWEVYFD
jgi:beta-xylosidase